MEKNPGDLLLNNGHPPVAGLETNLEKNIYYRYGFQAVMVIVNIQAVVIFFLTAALLFYVHNAKTYDRYMAETREGKKMQMVGLEYPNMGKIALMNWVAQATTQIMTFGFNDINERFELSRKNFTPKGWESFAKIMKLSGFAKNIIDAQQIITSVPNGEPTLAQEGLIGGKYSWVFDMGMLITYRAGGAKYAESKTVRVVIEQVPTRDNPNGIGIGEWYLY